tara:strand:- start:413 stop:1096 length:684 start_codon:yes stop_codon:yes gene_type:complete
MEDIQIITNADPEARNIEEKIDEYPPGGVPHEINDSFPDVKIPEYVDAVDAEEDPLPVIEEKKYITEEDVFTKHNEITQMVPVVKKVRKRRTMTEESLAKLALARVKAQETRKRNSELRKEGKMKTKKDIIKENKLQDIENRRPVVNNVVNKTENITNNITHEDIMKIATETTTKALLSYEEKRLIKKAEKKKKYEADHKKAIVRDTILKATGKKYGESGYFNSCFD